MTTTEEDRELRELFAPRRPDPARFAAGVAAKIREREAAAPEAETPRPGQHGLPRAASWLPFDVGIGAATIGKSFWAWLSLPVLLLAGAFGAFVGSMAMLRRRGAETTPIRRPPPAIAALPFVVVLLTIGIGRWHATLFADAVLAALLVSMVGLVVLVHGLAHEGRAHRRDVAQACSTVALWVWMGGGMAFFSTRFSSDAEFSGLAGWLVGLSILGHGMLASHTQRWLRAAVMLSLLALLDMPVWPTHRTAEQIAARLAEAAPDAGDRLACYDLMQTVEALQGCGVEIRPSDALRAAVSNARSNDERNPELRITGMRLGLVDARFWTQLVRHADEAQRLERMLSGEGALTPSYHDEWQLPALLATHALTTTEREHLLARITAGLADEAAMNPIEQSDVLVRWLDLLGRPDLVAPHRDAIVALIARHQIPPGQSGAGGFNPRNRHGGFSPWTTHTAMSLLLRLGATDAIDREALARCLRWSTQAKGNDLAHADFAWFAHAIAATDRSLVQFVVDERLLIGAILFVLLCAIATFQAPAAKPVTATLP